MKLSTLSSLFLVSLILILSGCGAKPQPKAEAIVDTTLPEIILTQNGTQSTMKSIALEWEVITDKRVRGIYVYKKIVGSNDTDKNNFLNTIDNRFSTHFLDDDVNPNSKYIYYFKTYSDQAESLKSKEYNIKTRVIFNSVSWLYAKGDMPRSAKIIWRPHKSKAVSAYIIQRKTLEDESFENIDKIYGRLNVEYIDTELKDKHTYAYRIRALTFDGITSNPSDVVTINTKALPLKVVNITATNNIAKKIKINWEKTKSADFSHYNIYRSQNIDDGYKLLAQVSDNNYVDNIKKDGKKYFYRISVTDMDYLESNHDVNYALGMTLIRPTTPLLLEVSLVDNKIILSWENTDKRTKTYTVVKKYKKGLFNFHEDKYDSILNTSFIDIAILSETTYTYYVLAVDENGITSNPSAEVVLETKEIDVSKVKLENENFIVDETGLEVEEVQIENVQVENIQVEEIQAEDTQVEEIQVEEI